MKLHVPYEQQKLDYMCGPRSMRMLLAFFGQDVALETLAQLAGTTQRDGTSRRGMVRALRTLNFDVNARHGADIQDLRRAVAQGIPPLIMYRDHTEDFGHCGVVVGVTPNHVVYHDPWHGPNQRTPHDEFERRWYGRHKTRYTRWFATARPR